MTHKANKRYTIEYDIIQCYYIVSLGNVQYDIKLFIY